jgi:hypothetical protein
MIDSLEVCAKFRTLNEYILLPSIMFLIEFIYIIEGHPLGLVTALVTGAGGYVSVTDEIPGDTSPPSLC